MTEYVETDRFVFKRLIPDGLICVERKLLEDSRGYLSRLYCRDDFSAVGMMKPVDQINHTLTHRRGSIRGLHFQRPPKAEVKLVICIAGQVFDVAVDLRTGSPTFLCWHGEILSAANRRGLLIPEGFAHGFQALTDDCQLIYFHTAPYDRAFEGGVRFNDAAIGIDWPLSPEEVSERDLTFPLVHSGFQGIRA